MTAKDIESITTLEQYNEIRNRLNELINEATEKGMLEPNDDNEYIRKIGRLAQLTSKYEDNYMDILQNI
jgi:hypothetical protein